MAVDTAFSTQEVMDLSHDIFLSLSTNGPLTRAELVKEISQPRTTIYDHLVIMISENKVRKFSRPTKTRGRPLIFFALM